MPAKRKLGPLVSTKWCTYGRFVNLDGGYASSRQAPCVVSRDFPTEADATAYLVRCAVRCPAGMRLDAIVARIDKHRVDRSGSENVFGQYLDKCTVTVRVGDGKGWWEG